MTKKKSKLEIPKNVILTEETIPIKLTEEDMLAVFEDIIQLKKEQEEKDFEIQEMKTRHKEEMSVLTTDRAELNNRIKEQFTIGRKGEKQKTVKVYIRKNFGLEIPQIEYVTPEGEIVYSQIMNTDDYQTTTTDWIEGNPLPFEEEGELEKD